MRIGFRPRLFIILLLFAVLPSIVLTAVWIGAVSRWLPLVSASAAWDTVTASGERAIAAARSGPLTPEQQLALHEHERALRISATQASRFQYLGERAMPVVALFAILLALVLGLVASRLAGHLSRQLSRPLAELVEWAGRIGRGEPLPLGPSRRGAPEFEMMRQRMRRMARELEQGRAKAIEAERLAAFRETARRVAHELKNPLTPIRFAVSRLRREVPPELADTVDVIAVESERLEEMARNFAQFGRLPEGPASDVDMGELVRYTAKATVPQGVPLDLQIEDGLPMVRGYHDALGRALSNVLINAVEACREGGAVAVQVRRTGDNGREAVEIRVVDSGCGIGPEQLARIWDPYVTDKPGGTGLGLAIARQTVLAHAGSVDAESERGKGTMIRFTIPLGEPAAVQPAAPAS